MTNRDRSSAEITAAHIREAAFSGNREKSKKIAELAQQFLLTDEMAELADVMTVTARQVKVEMALRPFAQDLYLFFLDIAESFALSAGSVTQAADCLRQQILALKYRGLWLESVKCYDRLFNVHYMALGQQYFRRIFRELEDMHTFFNDELGDTELGLEIEKRKHIAGLLSLEPN